MYWDEGTKLGAEFLLSTVHRGEAYVYHVVCTLWSVFAHMANRGMGLGTRKWAGDWEMGWGLGKWAGEMGWGLGKWAGDWGNGLGTGEMGWASLLAHLAGLSR